MLCGNDVEDQIHYVVLDVLWGMEYSKKHLLMLLIPASANAFCMGVTCQKIPWKLVEYKKIQLFKGDIKWYETF